MKKYNEALDRTGWTAGFFSGITWGIDTVLIAVVLMMSPFISDPLLVVGGVFVCSLVHDAFGALWMSIVTGIRKEWKQVFNAMRTTEGCGVAIGALFGGPMAMTCYILALATGGTLTTVGVTACYPLLGTLMAAVMLREKVSIRAWMGITVCVLGIFYLGYSHDTVSRTDTVGGVLLAGIAAFGWATEAVFVRKGLTHENINPRTALMIRETVSTLAYLIIIPLIFGDLVSLPKAVASVAEYWPAWLLLAGTAIIGMFSFFLWYKSIEIIGASRALCLNVTYLFWAVLIEALFLDKPLSLSSGIGGLLILIGVAFATIKYPLPPKHKHEIQEQA